MAVMCAVVEPGDVHPDPNSDLESKQRALNALNGLGAPRTAFVRRLRSPPGSDSTSLRSATAPLHTISYERNDSSKAARADQRIAQWGEADSGRRSSGQRRRSSGRVEGSVEHAIAIPRTASNGAKDEPELFTLSSSFHLLMDLD